MLNTRKLLYILPDLAYVAELLPSKKPHSFTIQAFRQINGEFIDENEFIPANIAKLFSKLDPEEYALILPDFLFTNTIVNVGEENDEKISEYLKTKLLPEIGLEPSTHQIDTTVLTQLKSGTRVQLSALEKTIMAPIRAQAKHNQVAISQITPLSWTIKSIVSLEPSISVLQLGEKLYSALHYIGIDQTNTANLEDIEAVAETIKTLKGSEPNIQTIYLLTNSVAENKIKELLSDTIPVQQLTTDSEKDSKMPPYVQQTIEAGMKTLTIPEYPVPKFELADASAEELKEYPKSTDDFQSSAESSNEEKSTMSDQLPKPNEASKKTEEAVVATSVVGATSLVASKKIDLNQSDVVEEKVEEQTKTKVEESTQTSTPENEAEKEEVEKTPATVAKTDPETVKEQIDLAQFAGGGTVLTQENKMESSSQNSSLDKSNPDSNEPTNNKPKKPVIKNKSGISNMLKMIFITIAVFATTVAIGVGVGLGLLSLSDSKSSEPTTTPITSPAPESMEITPSPTVVLEEINKEEVSILVVNATTTAGLAGKTATKLETSGFTNVDTANAQGTYDEAKTDLVSMSEENTALVGELETSSGLTLSFDAEAYATEDSAGKYDAVIVLTQ